MNKLEDTVSYVQGNEYFNQLLDLGYTGQQALEIMQRQAEEAYAEM